MSSIYPTISHIILIYYCVELILPSVRFLFDLYTSQSLHAIQSIGAWWRVFSHYRYSLDSQETPGRCFSTSHIACVYNNLSNPSMQSSTHSSSTRRKILLGNMPDSCPEIITDWTYIPLTKANEDIKCTRIFSMIWHIFYVSASLHRSLLLHLR